MKPVELVEPAEPTEPAEPAKPADSEPVEPAGQMEPVEPLERTRCGRQTKFSRKSPKNEEMSKEATSQKRDVTARVARALQKRKAKDGPGRLISGCES